MQVETKNAVAPACGLDTTFRVLGGKWKPFILYFLLPGPKRFGELKRSVRHASEKVLIQQLKELEADGLVKRTDYKEVPPRVDYALSPTGKTLAHALEPLCKWGDDNARFFDGEGSKRSRRDKADFTSTAAFDNLTTAVTTINTPMPFRIDEKTLIACLKGKVSDPRWRVYVQALFDEVDVSVIHKLVLDRLVTFSDLSKAIDIWRVRESENERWVREMASFEVGRPDAERPDRPR
ncbi:helix-turn-helix domain-containing protein [Rhodopseudomonas sp. BAL398]|uniref:winged helix-turn-helix transcriptional regulator n=1 Tax=Rhodopseudomonas TaxID=1073 RepID=UPI0009BBA7AC|nr:helix-turn-helix domain-containing protein [Rhodopseudomonas sp. BAL398]WOK18978.1 helix-turn-helix domain-containing protein [Rhodopseudomonas sp. BAL398]